MYIALIIIPIIKSIEIIIKVHFKTNAGYQYLYKNKVVKKIRSIKAPPVGGLGSMNKTYSWFRKTAFIEGVSFLVLLFIAMPLKYFANSPQAVTIVGGLQEEHNGWWLLGLNHV